MTPVAARLFSLPIKAPILHHSVRLGRISSYVPPQNSESKLCRRPSSDKCSFDFRNETLPTQSVQVTALPWKTNLINLDIRVLRSSKAAWIGICYVYGGYAGTPELSLGNIALN